jgi:hypothetical protein
LSTKISQEFATRLSQRKPDEPVRVVLMLSSAPAAADRGRRALKERRAELAEAARREVEEAEHDVDHVLEEYGGQRLTGGNLSTLGGLVVETTPAGVMALAQCPQVRVVMEDQTISLISK